MDWLTRITEEANEALIEDPQSELARQYLHSRGVAEQEILDFKIGLALPSRVKVDSCTKEFIPWAGQFLFNKLVFPLYSTKQDVIGIQTTSIPPAPKQYQQFYLYPQLLFPYLFGLPQSLDVIFQKNQVIMVEGVFDYFAVRQVADNALAMLTAGMPSAIKRFCKRYVKHVIMLTDMDTAGREGAIAVSREPGLMVSIPAYSAKDPGEMYKLSRLAELRRIIC